VPADASSPDGHAPDAGLSDAGASKDATAITDAQADAHTPSLDGAVDQ